MANQTEYKNRIISVEATGVWILNKDGDQDKTYHNSMNAIMGIANDV